MISPEDFALMVSEDIKGKSDHSTRELLRSKEHRDRWKDNLIQIIEKVAIQISDLEMEATNLRKLYDDEFFSADPAESIQHKIDKAKRFKFHAEKRLGEADRIIAMNVETADMRLSSFLRDAIAMHKTLKEDSGSYDTTDTSLWDALNGEWTFGVTE